MDSEYKANLRKRVKLTNPERLYDIESKDGSSVPYESADGRQLFNHYRHNMTNYDQVLDDVRAEQNGQLTGRQEKQVTVAAAEHIIQEYRDEHFKVVQDSQRKGRVLKNLFERVGVSTASALTKMLDSWSEKLKEVSKLENSQRSLQSWNDTYRVQRVLVKKLLKDEGVSAEICKKVDKIYGTRSVTKAVDLGSDFFNLEKSQTIKLVKSAVRYVKLQGDNHENG